MENESQGRFRQLTGFARYTQLGLGLATPLTAMVFILDLPLYLTGVSLFAQQYLGLFLGLILAYVFISVPADQKVSKNRVPWYDILCACASMVVGLYVMFYYPQLLITLGFYSPVKVILGIVAILSILEATRRLAGWPLVIIVAGFILYGRFGYLMPGVLAGKEISWPRLISQLYLGSEFLFGIALNTAAVIVFSFILFGRFLFGTGGAAFLIDVAQALMGRYRGGAAKICVVASSLMGTLSGSAVGNVAAVGVLTIPMMKRVGYPAHFAGGVEAVSSTGGCIMPPIMGAAAFIMAQFLGIPYAAVVIAALVPALLYYLSIFIQVDLRAAKIGLQGMSKEEIPSLSKTFKDGWIYVIPIVVLIFCLFALFLRESVAALYALASLLIVVLFRSDIRQKLKKTFLTILEETTQGMLEVTVICAAAGLVVGVITYTGLGLSLCRLLTDLGGGSLLLLALLTAFASIILGMGMPVTASYLLLAVLVAPAMVQLGVPALLAHLFVFYYGTLSFLTPPVCLAAYAAASIARAPMVPTAWQAMKLGIAAYVVPFIFIFKPGLALMGSADSVALSIFDGVLGIAVIAVGVEGYLRRDLGWSERALFIIAGIILLIPGWSSRIAGLVLIALLILLQLRAGFAIKQKEDIKITI